MELKLLDEKTRKIAVGELTGTDQEAKRRAVLSVRSSARAYLHSLCDILARGMSFDITLYTRDRPIIDENQSSYLERDGAYGWELEKWLFGGMIVTVAPYTFEAGRHDELAYFFADEDEDEDKAPDWTSELRFVVSVSGRLPDDDFFNWFDGLAASARGVIYNPDEEHDDRLEHVDGLDPHEVALRMVCATRPVYSDTDDRTTDLIRRDTGPGVAPLEVWRALQENVYGAPLTTAARAGLRLTWPAVQHLYLAAEIDADGPIQFSLFKDPIRGRRDWRAFLELTTHPDPQIDALLREPGRASELASRVPDGPLDAMLSDALGREAAPLAPLADEPALRNELVAFWERVIELDPRLDPAMLTDELRRPRMEC